MKITSCCMVSIAVSVQVFIAGCGKNEEPLQTSEKRPVQHAPEDASRLIGKSKDQLLALWGKPSSWSFQGQEGSEVEQFTYHFLKSGGKNVLQEHMRAGETSDGELTISFSPFAAEVLENYWVWVVCIEKGFVTDARCLNNDQQRQNTHAMPPRVRD